MRLKTKGKTSWYFTVKSGRILGDPGADSGCEGKSKRATKKIGEEKSRGQEKAPGDKVLSHQFQTVGVVLASDWCQKIFVFFCPITRQLVRSPFRVLLQGTVHEVNMSAIFSLLAYRRRRNRFVEKLILQPPESSTKQRTSYMRQMNLFREVLGDQRYHRAVSSLFYLLSETIRGAVVKCLLLFKL